MAATRRADVYTKIHKALRRVLFETSLAACRTDFTDIDQATALGTRLDSMVAMLHLHAEKEEQYQLPALEARMPGAAHDNLDAHVELENQIAAMQEAYRAILADGIDDRERDTRGEHFFQELNGFIGNYLLHMHEEETVVAPRFWQVMTDDEINAVTAALINSMPPEEIMRNLELMLRSSNSPEREELLGILQSKAPAEVVARFRAIAEEPAGL